MEFKMEKMEIELSDLLHYLKKRIWIAVLASILCVAGCWMYFKVFSAPQYTAAARMYVLNRSEDSGVGSADFQISNYVVNDYKVLITGQNVTKKVIEQLGLNMSPESLARKIEVTSATNTRVLQINVTDTNAQRAADIANAVYEIAAVQIQAIMDVDAVQLVYAADVPQMTSRPTLKTYGVITAVVGLLLSLGILIAVYVMDDTIRTELDVERHLGLHVWGVIPESNDMQIGHESKSKSRSRGFSVMKGNGRR